MLFALFAAVRHGLGTGIRFLWVRDLAKADVALALLVTVLTGFAAASAPATTQNVQQTQIMLALTIFGTAIFLWTTASTVALSVGAGAAVSLLQNWLVKRNTRAA
jgi:membrane protein insertase Oxa1/YidC/SpoIIIJ